MAATDLSVFNRALLCRRLEDAKERFRGEPLGEAAAHLLNESYGWTDAQVVDALNVFSDTPDGDRLGKVWRRNSRREAAIQIAVDAINQSPEGDSKEMSIRQEFTVHVLNAEGMARANRLARAFSSFLDEVEEICGAEGRAIAIVRTKLQEASFFAKRAMAENPGNQEDPG